jgi:hypothetical protein
MHSISTRLEHCACLKADFEGNKQEKKEKD